MHHRGYWPPRTLYLMSLSGMFSLSSRWSRILSTCNQLSFFLLPTCLIAAHHQETEEIICSPYFHHLSNSLQPCSEMCMLNSYKISIWPLLLIFCCQGNQNGGHSCKTGSNDSIRGPIGHAWLFLKEVGAEQR